MTKQIKKRAPRKPASHKNFYVNDVASAKTLDHIRLHKKTIKPLQTEDYVFTRDFDRVELKHPEVLKVGLYACELAATDDTITSASILALKLGVHPKTLHRWAREVPNYRALHDLYIALIGARRFRKGESEQGYATYRRTQHLYDMDHAQVYVDLLKNKPVSAEDAATEIADKISALQKYWANPDNHGAPEPNPDDE